MASKPKPAPKPKGIDKTVADIGDFLGSVGYNMSKPGAISTGALNLGDSLSRWWNGQDPAAAGRGAGDIAANNLNKTLAQLYPKQYAAEQAANAAPAAAPAVPGTNPAGFSGPLIDPATGKSTIAAIVNGSKPITPSTIASRMAQAVGGARAAEMAIAKKLGQEYVPGQAAGTAQAAYDAAQQALADQASADALAKSNAAIESAYNPVLDFLNAQKKQTEDRYAQNAANLKNIFGALTGLSAADTKRVNDQFTSSIAKQQADLAARTAEQRAAQDAGASQAVATGAERGGGPAMQGSPTATATEQGIGQANAIQSNWEGLMGAQQANAITDITNRGAGYGQQEVAANNQMVQNLQDALSAIGSQTASTKSQIAQAKVARDQAITNNQYDVAAAAQKQIDALQLQASKNTGITDVAKIRAAGQIAAKRLSGSGSGKAAKVPGSEAIKNRADQLGPTVYQQIQTSASDAYNAAYALLNPDPNAKSVKMPTAANVKAAWQAAHRGTAASVSPLASDYIDSAYK